MSRVASQAENVRAATRAGGVVPVRRRRKGERGGWLGLIGMDYQDKSGPEKDVQAGERHRKERETGTERQGQRRQEEERQEGKNLSIAAAVCPAACLSSQCVSVYYFFSLFLFVDPQLRLVYDINPANARYSVGRVWSGQVVRAQGRARRASKGLPAGR